MVKKKIKQDLKRLLRGTCLLALFSCGSYGDDAFSSPQEEMQTGLYRTTLTPLNSNVSGLVGGMAEVSLDGDSFEVKINISGAPDATHPQYIYAGNSCPDTLSDINQDSFIDGVELQATAGKILIPLDDDLKSQAAGGHFPAGVNYKYHASTTFLAMLSELKLPDSNDTDAVTKLASSDEINLSGKIVIIHGVPSSSVTFPETVKGLDGMDAHDTLPIACGVLVRHP